MRLLFVILITMLLSDLHAQDPHFSLYDFVPQQLNPALSGQFDGDYRLMSTYRNQWFAVDDAAGFNTIELEFDYKFEGIKEDFWSLSFNVMNDQAGLSNFRQFSTHFGGAYSMVLAKADYNSLGQTLSFGTQIGIAQNSANWSDLWFGRQYDFGIFDVNQSIDNGESGLGTGNVNSGMYMDVNLGLLYSIGVGKNQLANIGFGAFHLNQPTISLRQDGEEKLKSKYIFHADIGLEMSESFAIIPQYILILQKPFSEHQLGVKAAFMNLDDQGFKVGLAGRAVNTVSGFGMDALIFSFDVSIQAYQIGFAYDFTISDFAKANNDQGSFELHFVYQPLFY